MVSASDLIDAAWSRIAATAGGEERLRVVGLLGAVLGLDTADKGTISAVADQLEHAFHIGNTGFGLLLAAVSLVGAVGTLPMGVLADRVQRKTVLSIAIALWALAMIFSGLAQSYAWLLAMRVLLGIVTAAARPCVASLTGDSFPAAERARVYGMILAGELIGAGIGFFVSGEVSSLIDWRWSFYVMALPSLGLVWAIWRHLPEPERGGHAWLTSGRDDGAGSQDTEPAPSMQKTVKDAAVPPRRELILRQDPTRRSLWWAIGYLLRVPTYRLLIAASALAYYFFAGVRAFGMIFFTGHYGLPRAVVGALVFVVGLGAIAGVVFGGRFSERLRRRGWFNARILVPAAALFASVPLLAVGIWTRNPWLALLMMTIGAAALAAAVAPIDAARLDIVHPRLWGRGEAGRMALRSVLEGGAPLLFGYCSTLLGGGDRGLMWTFLIMLIPMLAASSLALPARRSYLRDVATAAASAAALQRRR